MPSTISLTYGINCQPSHWKTAIKELRDSCRDTQYSCFAMNLLEQTNVMPDFTQDLNVLLNQCVDKQVVRNTVEIQMLLETQSDADPAMAARLAEWAERARQAARAVGIWRPVVNLIWIVQDGRRNRQAAESLVGAESAFDRRFIISTKRSDLTVARDTAYCWHGVSALIRVLSEKPNLDGRDMTIGFARLQCSLADMQEYAKDQLARKMRQGGMNHDNAVEKLKKRRGNWLSGYLKELQEYVQGVFYYVPAGSQPMDMSVILDPEQAKQKVKKLAEDWSAQLLVEAKKTPFPEDFLNAMNSNSWQEQLQCIHRDNMAVMGLFLKKQLLHGKLIQAYNDYLEQYKQRFGQILQLFVSALTDATDALKPELQTLIERRNRIAQRYLADAQFINRCENAFVGITDRIKSLASSQRMGAADGDYLSEDDVDQAAWEAFFDQSVTAMGLKPQEIRDELRERDGNQIASLCDQNLDPEANTVYARMLHDNFSVDRFKRFYILPQNVTEPLYQNSSPNFQHTTIWIDVPDFGNIEKLVIAEVPDPLKTLTPFQEQPGGVTSEQPSATYVSRAALSELAEQEAEEMAAEDPADTFNFDVSEDGEVSFTWPDLSERMLTLHLYDEQNRIRVAIQRVVLTEFQSCDNKVIFDELIGQNGLFTVSLQSSTGVLASKTLELRKDLFVRDTQKQFQVSGRSFVQHTLEVDNAALEGDDIQSYMELVIGEQRIGITGKRKKKATEWVIIMEEGYTPDIATQDRAGRCYRLIIG